MSTMRLAIRNLWRSPRRTILTTTTIVAGVGVYVLGDGFVAGTTENIILAAIEGTVGHVMARPADYPDQPGQHPVDELLHLSPETKKLLDQEAVAWTERTYFAPLAASGSDSLRVTAIGFDPATDEKVFPRTHWKVDGEVPTGGRRIAVGYRAAKLMRIEPGARMVLQVKTHRGAINALEVEVAGIVRTNNPALDRLGIFVPSELAQELINTKLTSHVSVRLDSRRAAGPFKERLAASMGKQAEVVTYAEESAELVRLQQIRKASLQFVLFILMALAAFGIANTILMAAHERVREVGTLRAMGMTKGAVMRLFLIEGGLMGLIGGLLGALWGGALIYHWSIDPIDFSDLVEKSAQGSMSFSTLIYTQVNPDVIVATIILGVVVAIVASVYPARVASRMPPSDAVRAD